MGILDSIKKMLGGGDQAAPEAPAEEAAPEAPAEEAAPEAPAEEGGSEEKVA
jgi:hypothetical protein